jgi:hypothetical protein
MLTGGDQGPSGIGQPVGKVPGTIQLQNQLGFRAGADRVGGRGSEPESPEPGDSVQTDIGREPGEFSPGSRPPRQRIYFSVETGAL